MDTVTVSAADLRAILEALSGPGYLIRELQAIRSLGNSPIDRLIAEFDAQVDEFNEQVEPAKDGRS